jgi:type II secretory pathway pseudopilin PulG
MMSRRNRRRWGMTLAETLAVVALLGVFAAVAAVRIGTAPLQNFAAQSDARRLALDLLQTQRRAIATGDNHYVEFTSSGGQVVSYTVYRRLSGGGVEVVEATREFAQQETITASHVQAEFQFDGSALASYQVTLAGPNKSWQVTVIAATGAVQVVAL